ncbi:hypothetical protein BC941DRAFT_427765 [Chlamydoabsidia padenii]|nr:hypothetical protein BC941DRAFT_427765 [Chlamydoabsidia padenii]
MVDFLSSPLLFPSDMESSKLSADPTFKLPMAMNWTDLDYDNTPLDKPMTGWTDLVQLEPINDKGLPLLLSDYLKTSDALSGGYNDNDSGYGDDNDDYNDKQMTLRAHLRGALAAVENDMQQNGYDRLYTCRDTMNDQWSWCDELLDVPDLVHSISSSSAHSLMDPSPLLLESDISSHLDDDDDNHTPAIYSAPIYEHHIENAKRDKKCSVYSSFSIQG